MEDSDKNKYELEEVIEDWCRLEEELKMVCTF